MCFLTRLCLTVCVLALLWAPQEVHAAIFLNRWNVTDTSVFSANFVVAVGAPDGRIYLDSASFSGYRNPVPDDRNETAAQTVSEPMSSSAAFRLGAVSDLFVSFAVGYMEQQGMLPFPRSSPIPVDYLPPALQTLLSDAGVGAAYLLNPNFGTRSTFISLNMLLQHTSSLTEDGFEEFATTQGPIVNASTPSLPTRAEFLDTLFSTTGASTFSSTCQPSSASNVWEYGGCVAYSRTNVALASYVLETILSAQQLPFSTLESFVYTRIMVPMQLTGTFFLNKRGRMPLPSYPEGLTDDVADTLYASTTVMSVDYDWSGPVSSFLISAEPFADVMIYTTMADLQLLLANALLPGSDLYTALGVSQLSSNVVQLTRSGTTVNSESLSTVMGLASVNGAVGRGLGLTQLNLSAMCDIMGEQLVAGCNSSRLNVSSPTDAYGLGGTTAFNQVAILCATNSYSSVNICVGAEVSYTDSSTYLSARLSLNGAMVVAYSVMQGYLLNTETRGTSVKVPPMTGLWIFLGVLATLIVSVFLSYLTDYFVQPLPPAKVIAPVPGARGAGVETGWGGGGVGAITGSNALSPLPAVNLFGDTDMDGITPPRQDDASVTNRTAGSSTSGRRGRRVQGTSTQLSIDSSSTPLGGASGPRYRRHRGDESTSTTSSGPRSVARFDAYI